MLPLFLAKNAAIQYTINSNSPVEANSIAEALTQLGLSADVVLDLAIEGSITQDIISADFATDFPVLLHLSFDNSTFESFDLIFKNSMPKIQSLDIGKAKSVAGGFFTAFPNVQTLIMNEITSIPSSTFFDGLASLKSLSIKGIKKINFAFTNCPVLSELNLNAEITEIAPSCFASLPIKAISLTKIVEIPEAAFSGCTQLETATFSSVTTIGKSAFENCALLSAINLPDVTSLSESAFSGCAELSKLTIGKFTTVPDSCFSGCVKLTFADDLLSSLTSIGASAFSGTAITFITNNNVETVGEQAFMNSGLQKASFSKLSVLPDSIFEGCASLTSISLPQQVTYGIKCFKGTGFASIDSFPSLTNITESTFEGCVALTKVESDKIVAIGKAAFKDCSGLTTVSLTNAQFVDIPNSAFMNCKALTEINFPNVVTIGESAFQACDVLEKVVFPVATTIGKKAFRECPAIKEVDQPTMFPKLESMDQYCFYKCTAVTKINFPTLQVFPNFAFAGCLNLVDINTPMVSQFGNQMFKDNLNIVKVYFPSLYRCGNSVWEGCLNLVEADLPNLTVGGGRTFTNCAKLNKVNLPVMTDSALAMFQGTALTELKINACRNIYANFCYGLTTLAYVEMHNITNILESAFAGCVNLKLNLDMPLLVTIDPNAFENVTFFESLEFPALETLGANAFLGCVNLKKVHLPSFKAVTEESFVGMDYAEEIILDKASSISPNAFINHTNLKVLKLPLCYSLRGDCAFEGCSSLEYLDLSALTNCIRTAENTFKGCVSLKTIKFPAAPPITFHKDVFRDLPEDVKIVTPQRDNLYDYDDDLSVEGDIAGDFMWAGIKLGIEKKKVLTTKEIFAICLWCSFALIIIVVTPIVLCYKKNHRDGDVLLTVEQDISIDQYT